MIPALPAMPDTAAPAGPTTAADGSSPDGATFADAVLAALAALTSEQTPGDGAGTADDAPVDDLAAEAESDPAAPAVVVVVGTPVVTVDPVVTVVPVAIDPPSAAPAATVATVGVTEPTTDGSAAAPEPAGTGTPDTATPETATPETAAPDTATPVDTTIDVSSTDDVTAAEPEITAIGDDTAVAVPDDAGSADPVPGTVDVEADGDASGPDERHDEREGRASRSPVAGLAEQLRAARPDADGATEGNRGIGTDLAAGVHELRASRATAPTTPTSPATTPAPPAAEPLPVPDQIVEQVSPLIDRGEGTHEVTIDLDPADLGRLRLSVTSEDGVVSIRVLADDPATRRLLQESIEQLRAALEGAGVQTGDLDVDHRRTTDHQPWSAGRERDADDAAERDRRRPRAVPHHYRARATDALDVLL